MRVGLIGAGNMARALARGWGDPVLASDSGSGRAAALVAELGGEALSNGDVAERADLVVLCHKPYQLRPVGGRGNGRRDVRVHFVAPKNFNDVQDVADKFKDSIPVILNLQATDTDLSKRLIDFSSGLTYALDGGMQRIADKVFLLTPQNVEVSAEQRAELIEKGFFNQS